MQGEGDPCTQKWNKKLLSSTPAPSLHHLYFPTPQPNKTRGNPMCAFKGRCQNPQGIKAISLSLLSCPQNPVVTLETNRRKRKSLRSQNCITAIKKGVQRSCFTQRLIINSSQNKNKMLKSHLAKGVLPMHQDTSSTWLIQKHSGSFFPLVSRGVRAPQHCSTHRPGLRPRPKFKLYMKGCHATQLALYSESKPNINWRKRFSLLFCFAYA